MNALPHSVMLVSGAGGLPMIRVDGPQGWAQIYLHGAHVTAWAPSGQESALWMSKLSRFDEHTAIRGGIPVCFPWFGPLAGRPDAPRHGFARTAEWALDEAHDDGQDVTVRLRLADSEATRNSGWPHPFVAILTVVVGSRLTVALEVTNTGSEPMSFEEVLHTYLRVAEVTKAEVIGFEGVAYVDTTKNGGPRDGEHGPLRIGGEVDSVYTGAPQAVTVNDVAGGRAIQVEKSGSGTTVVWNPGPEGAHATVDIEDDGWTTMLCVEPSNVAQSAIRLAPGEHHVLTTTIGLELLAP